MTAAEATPAAVRLLHTHSSGHAGSGSEGPYPVLALHGVRGHGGRWNFLGPRQVFAPDLRGHGLSMLEPPWTLEQHADDVLAAVAHLGLESIDLVGISFGAAVALHSALRAPQLIRRLVLLDPATAIAPGTALARAREALAAPSFATREEARTVRRKHWPQVQAAVLNDEIDAHLARSPDGRWRWRYEPAAVAAAFSEAARPLPPLLPRVPTLVVRANRGSLLTDATVAEMSRQGWAVADIDAGHGMDIEAPALVTALIDNFLNT